jgi:benzodiazapine receptor
VKKRDAVSLGGFLAATYGAAALGTGLTAGSLNTWYRMLRRPRWTPPDRLFGPVWTILYTLMAVSAWLIRRAATEQPAQAAAAQRALTAWGVQLVLNVTWPAVFFGGRRIGGGLVVMGFLWIAIVASLGLARHVSRPAAGLLLPYLAWTSFAAALNARIWHLNRRS